MRPKDLKLLGIPGECRDLAVEVCRNWKTTGQDDRDLAPQLRALVENPSAYLDIAPFQDLALAMKGLADQEESETAAFTPKPWRQWGHDLEDGAVQQMKNAARLPIAVRGALMPDAHQGYGLPIGGVLATRNAVIPYAVGVDIACRMKLTVLDMSVKALKMRSDHLAEAIETETRFGIAAHFKDKRQHPVLDENWNISPITRKFKNKAWSQLGSSGSGNHFVEFGTLTLTQPDLGLDAGVHLALLSHSGSRGTGASVASHYSRLAMDQRPELPKALRHLAWLDLDTHEGQEYWAAMELMGKYAAANHACIHEAIAAFLGVGVKLDLENHHNFAWKETHDGEELVVHRKGATPAGAGVLGIIPGSMTDPGFIVRGKGNTESLESAAHGAGRRMSRTKANREFKGTNPQKLASKKGVRLLSAGLDELPMCYKNIESVMDAQSDLVDIVARFDPKLVKMARAGEKPED